MTFSEAVNTCLREKYATFSGRASRSEYWWFALASWLILAVVGFVLFGLAAVTGSFDNGLSGIGIILALIAGIIYLALIIPMIAALVRRFHDRNLSGWWYLASIVVGFIPFVGFLASIAALVITVLKGTEGPNKFGPDPLGAGDAEIFS